MTSRALKAIERADVIIGNSTYLDQLEPIISGKEIIRSSMGKEVERARTAATLSEKRRVVIVSGGDAGIYGMAGVVLEVLERGGIDRKVEVIPGVTAATAAASRTGSPLSGDFAVISLSDLLTPMEIIEKRLAAVFSAGIPVVLYNPKSRGRPHNLSKALRIAGEHLPDTTPVALVRNAYRDGEEIVVTTLGGFPAHEHRVDMHSTLIIGNEESRIWRTGDHARGIITPRGYHRKYVY
jgi:precorrin-3B C17-methyltransferase